MLPVDLLDEIGTTDEALGDLFGWMWALAQDAASVYLTRGDQVAGRLFICVPGSTLTWPRATTAVQG
jgi:hypothetical protein